MFIEASAKAGFNIKVSLPFLLPWIFNKVIVYYQLEFFENKAMFAVALVHVFFFMINLRRMNE